MHSSTLLSSTHSSTLSRCTLLPSSFGAFFYPSFFQRILPLFLQCILPTLPSVHSSTFPSSTHSSNLSSSMSRPDFGYNLSGPTQVWLRLGGLEWKLQVPGPWLIVGCTCQLRKALFRSQQWWCCRIRLYDYCQLMERETPNWVWPWNRGWERELIPIENLLFGLKKKEREKVLFEILNER